MDWSRKVNPVNGLHMNEKGYAIWKDAVRPYLQ